MHLLKDKAAIDKKIWLKRRFLGLKCMNWGVNQTRIYNGGVFPIVAKVGGLRTDHGDQG
jgi:hypothetical protein